MLKRKEGFSGERAIIVPASVMTDIERDPRFSMLHITDIGYYPNAENHFRERKEPIKQYVFIYCIEGSGWVRLNGSTCEVKENQYIILPANQPHAYGSATENSWTIYWIHFKGIQAGEFARGAHIPIDIKPNLNSRISDRIALFEEIFHTLELGYGKENLLYSAAVFHHFLASLRYIHPYRNAILEEKENTDLITASIHYMKENIEKKLTLNEIADHLGYSASHFSTLFSSRTGYSPINYFNQLKIQKACHLLDFTTMKVNQICHKIGIDDSYYFSRLFTKTMGISPREYRHLKKG